MLLEAQAAIGISTKYSAQFNAVSESDSIVFASGHRLVLMSMKQFTNQKMFHSAYGEVHAVTSSVDGSLLASAHGDGKLALSICVWKVSEGECILKFDAPKDLVTSLSFSPDNRLIAAGTKLGRTFIVDINTSQSIIATKPGSVPHYIGWDIDPKIPSGMALDGPVYKLFSASEKYLHVYVLCAESSTPDSIIRVFTTVKDFPVPGSLKDVNSVVVLDHMVVFGCQLGEIAFYDVGKSAFVYKVRPTQRGCQSLAVCGQSILSGHNNGQIFRIDITGSGVQITGETNIGVPVMSISTGFKTQPYLTTHDGRLFSLNLRNMEANVLIHSPSPKLHGLSVDSSGNFIGTAAQEGVGVWNVKTLKMVSKKPLNNPALCCKFDVTDQSLLSGWENGSLCLTGLDGGLIWEKKSAHQSSISAVACTSVSYLSGDAHGVIHIWTRKSHELVMKYHIQKKRIRELLPDIMFPTLIHSCGEDGSASTYDMREEKIVSNHINKEEGSFTSIIQSREGNLYTTGKPPTIHIWERGRVESVGNMTVEGHAKPVILLHSACISPCGRYIVCFSQDDHAFIWDTKSNRIAGDQDSFATGITRTAFSPDGKSIYGIEAGGSVVIWSFNPNQ